MRNSTYILGIFVVLICAAAVQRSALAVCPSGMSPEIFCDDYDCYCSESDCSAEPPIKCTEGNGKQNYLMRAVWTRTSVDDANSLSCGAEFNIEDSLLVFSEPFGNGMPNQATSELGHSTVDLSDGIPAAYGSQYNAMLGTDANPLVMTFNMNNQTADKVFSANVYMELSAGSDRAPTDYVYAPNCSTYCDPPVSLIPQEIICAQNVVVPGCPDLATAPVHASIAVGCAAKLDTDPCNCEKVNHGSTNRHLSFFDGKKWWVLDEGVFPGSGNFEINGGLGLDPAFDLNGGTVVLTIKTSTVQIDYTPYLNGTYGETSTATASREYMGPFDAIRAGFATSCELNASSWTDCPVAPRKCLGGSLRAGRLIFDDFVLYGGEGDIIASVAGACCLTNGDCEEIRPESCAALGGEFAGPSITCEETLCCPYPFADGDSDGDVDQQDFGLWQACFSGAGQAYLAGCDCYDRDNTTGALGGDGDVDRDDFAWFTNCVTGPTILLDVENPPAGCIP